MSAFFREVIAAIKEGPAIFFAPLTGAVKVAKQSAPTTATTSPAVK